MGFFFSAVCSPVIQPAIGVKLMVYLVILQDNSCTCKGGERLGDRRWCAADGIRDVPSPLTEEVLCHW